MSVPPAGTTAVFPPRVLVLNAASSVLGARFGLLGPHGVLHEGHADGRGAATELPMLLDRALDRLGWPASSLRLIAVVVGPGSFTGLRASLALAHGLALGAEAAAVVGVSIGEALGPALDGLAGGGGVWCVSHARRGRVFIEHPGEPDVRVEAAMLDGLPGVRGAMLVAGDAEQAVAEALLNRGDAVRRAGLAAPSMVEIAAAALRRQAGALPPRPAQPLYVDPPEARLPAARPVPA